jgi:hypothetical protein
MAQIEVGITSGGSAWASIGTITTNEDQDQYEEFALGFEQIAARIREIGKAVIDRVSG